MTVVKSNFFFKNKRSSEKVSTRNFRELFISSMYRGQTLKINEIWFQNRSMCWILFSEQYSENRRSIHSSQGRLGTRGRSQSDLVIEFANRRMQFDVSFSFQTKTKLQRPIHLKMWISKLQSFLISLSFHLNLRFPIISNVFGYS